MHLEEIAFHVAPGAHAVLLLDQAGWHGSTELVVPPNITLMPLPPRCPELNPVENIWQFMRDNWLSNRIFTSYDNIVDHCCEAAVARVQEDGLDHLLRHAALPNWIRASPSLTGSSTRFE